MARQIEDIIVKLGLQGFEGLDKIRSSFRDLSKVTQMSDKDITAARDALFDFAKTAGNTEAVNKGLISAFQGLRTQADLCGDAYAELSRDIADLEAVSRGYTAQATAERASLAAQYGAITNNTEALRRQRTALIELQQATRVGSQLFAQLGADIQKTTARLDEIEGVQRRTNATLNRGLPSSSVKIRRDLADIRDRISLEQEELERLQTLTSKERDRFSQGTELRGPSGVTRAIAEQERILARFRQQAGALNLSENVRQRREAVRDANALFMSPEFTGTGSRSAEGLTRSFGELPNSIAGINQGLSELRERLNNVTIGTSEYIKAALQAAAAQRELREATQGVAAAFVQQLRTGEIAPSLANLREVISSVRTEQSLLDTSSTSGARAFQLLELQARSLERQLSALQATQASLAATPASGFAAFSQSITAQEGSRAVKGSVRRNRERLDREQRRMEREAVEFFSNQPTGPLLLPAAGQTTSTGRGMARNRLTLSESGSGEYGPAVETIFGERIFRNRRARTFMGLPDLSEAETGLSARVGTSTQAIKAQRDAASKAAADLSEYRRAIREAAAANNGSIDGLSRYKDALERMRSAIAPTNADFARLTKRIEAVDTQLNKLSLSADRPRLTGMQLAQGVGAALSGGIFGGPEGLIGGLGGMAIGAMTGAGGVGGAFAGAAFGAQIGMFRQQLAVVTDYSARIDKLQIALRGIVGSQAAYSQALAAAASVTRDLNIPQETAIQGMTRLSAAVQGAGGTVGDSAFAFRAVSEAVKATGGNAEQADGALLALTQVFSKGKVSAEELNQIAERLPGTFTLFAKAAGKSGPELQKALQQGEVGLNDLMKFLQLISSEYGQTALKIAASSQEAGARLSVAMKNMQLEVGRALQPIGASLQSAFADFITKITPAAVAAIRSIGNAFSYLTIDPVGKELAKLTLQVGLATAGVLLFVPAVKALGLALAFVGTKIKELLILMAKNPLTLLAIAGTAAAIKVADAVLEQKRLNDEVERSLAIAAKAPASGVATQISSTQDALRSAREKYAADLDAVRDFTGTPFVFEIVAGSSSREVDRLEAKLRKLETVYKARIELETIFKGLDPQAGVPTGYKLVNGRLAYLSPGQGYIDAETGKPVSGGLSTFAGGSKDTAEKLSTSYLQAFEQREEAIAQARIQREEQIADIRKQALEQARQLERQFADERRALERDIARSKRGTADIEEDIARQRRLLAGEDPRIIEAEQRIVDVYREARDRDIDIKEQYADREFNRARTLADFQKKTADDINKANETYAKSLGKIHRDYAKDVGKILDEASGKTAKRLATAGELIRAISDLQALQTARIQVGAPPVPSASDMPPAYKQQQDKIDALNKKLLQSRRQAPSTADRFFAAYADQPQFEDVAGLQPLPITRMQRQAARPLRLRQQRYPERTTVNTTFNNSVLQRIERMQQVVDNWDPIGSQWKEIQNSLREVKRSRPAASVPAAVLAGIARRMWSDMLPVVRKSGGLARETGGLSGSQLDFSEYLNDKQLRVLKQGLRSTLEPAYVSQFGINKQPEALTRAVGLLAPMFRDFRRALITLLEQEAAQGRVYAEKTLHKLGVGNAKATPAPNPDTIEQRFNRLFNQPNIVPGVGKDFEGAMLPSGDFNTDKLTRNLGNVATRQLQGVLAQVTDQLIAATPYRVGDTIGADAQRTRAQRIQVVPATKGADKASEDARAAAAAKSAAQLQRELLEISNEALAPLKEQNIRLQEQNDLFQAQQRYIKQGITPALAEQYAQIDQIGELNRRIAARQTATAIDKALTDGANNETVLQLVRNHRDLTASIDSNVNSAKNLASAYQDAQKAARFTQDARIGLGLREGAEQYVQSIGTMREATAQLAQTGIKGVEDAIFSLVTTGTANFREFAASILRDTSRMIIQQLILRSVMQIIGAIGGGSGFGFSGAGPVSGASVFGGAQAGFNPLAFSGIKLNAMGNAFAANSIVPYAMGGIVDKPTLFKFADGGAGRLGLMGEAGPEAIMPLRRLPSGRLGVESAGGGTTNVVVNVDASGSQVQGDSTRGEALGRAVSAAVQAELVRQQRPGGLLAGTRQ